MGRSDSVEFVAGRYDRLAPVFVLMEPLFLMPPGLRQRAVDQLRLSLGDRVLEVGCGTGRNIALIRRAVGVDGQVEGIDLSPGSLTRARRLCTRRGWNNVVATQQDAATFTSVARFDAVLFSLSYSVIPDRFAALARAWDALLPGGRLVIMDSCLPPGRRGSLLRPVVTALSRLTVLGDPDVHAWKELSELGTPVRRQRLWFETYVIASTQKPES